MIPQLINELYDAKEFAAVQQLAIAYLNHEEDAQILGLLAGTYHEEKKFDKALECLEKLPETTNTLINRASCLYFLHRAPEAEEIVKSLPTLNDGYRIDLSLYLNAQGKVEESQEILAPIADHNDRASFNYGWYLLSEDKLQEGYKYIRVGAKFDLRVWGHEWILKQDYNIGPEYRWESGEKVDTIAFYLEGGLGDEMIFVRYAENLKQYCNTLKIFSQKSLIPLLEECGYENVYPPEYITKTGWDKFVPAMSAPYFLGLNHPREGVTFPYLKRKANPVDEMNRVANGKKKICIRWRGNPEFEHEQFRSVPVEGLLGLEKYGQLFSLQIEDSNLPKNANVWDLSHLIDDWCDTYDIIAESDLVVTSCTAIAHLAGAMGAKVVVLPPLVPYITWNVKENTWYPDNVVVIQQMEYNSWDKTIEKLHDFMKDF